MAKKNHSTKFEKYKTWYEKGWCTKEQLYRITELGGLTPAEYQEITGEPYEEPNKED